MGGSAWTSFFHLTVLLSFGLSSCLRKFQFPRFQENQKGSEGNERVEPTLPVSSQLRGQGIVYLQHGANSGGSIYTIDTIAGVRNLGFETQEGG